MSVVIGIADSGIAQELMPRVIHAKKFVLDNGAIQQKTIDHDSIGHGTEISRIIARYCPDVYFVLAQVINPGGRSSMPLLTNCIPWLAQHSDIINLSLGTASQSALLEQVCETAQSNGCRIVASAPAVCKKPIYPAGFKSVTAVTGDIRCRPGEFSLPPVRSHTALTANFAACCYPSKADQTRGKGGSSYAAAHFTGWLAKARSARLSESEWYKEMLKMEDSSPINLLEILRQFQK